MTVKLSISTFGQGLHDITEEVQSAVGKTGIESGICNVFIQHTSASLLIQENADPTAKSDLERWLNRLVPEGDSLYRHIAEGPDDMPSHIKSMLTAVSLTVPVMNGTLALGTWQGIYLWEHRRSSHNRILLVSVVSDSPPQ